MKSSFFLILSFLLATAILAPSVVTLFGLDAYSGLVMEFGEEENKKEEKKEVGEKDFLFDLSPDPLASKLVDESTISNFYIEGNYAHSADIFLPPPEHTI